MVWLGISSFFEVSFRCKKSSFIIYIKTDPWSELANEITMQDSLICKKNWAGGGRRVVVVVFSTSPPHLCVHVQFRKISPPSLSMWTNNGDYLHVHMTYLVEHLNESALITSRIARSLLNLSLGIHVYTFEYPRQ